MITLALEEDLKETKSYGHTKILCISGFVCNPQESVRQLAME